MSKPGNNSQIKNPPSSQSGTKLTDVLAAIYKDLDAKVAKGIQNIGGTTCKAGCTHCCHILTSIGLAEGVALAERVLDMGLGSMLPKLRSAALAVCEDGITPFSYMDKKLPCVFLDGGLCSVYQQRPAVCRFYYVMSDPALCSLESNGEPVAVIDLGRAHSPIWELNVHAGRSDPELMDRILISPIPVMVLFCLSLMLREEPGYSMITEARKGIPDPDAWFERYGKTVAESERKSPKKELSKEELVQLRANIKKG